MYKVGEIVKHQNLGLIIIKKPRQDNDFLSSRYYTYFSRYLKEDIYFDAMDIYLHPLPATQRKINVL